MGEVARASGSEGVHTGPLSRCATAPPSLTGQGSLFLSLRPEYQLVVARFLVEFLFDGGAGQLGYNQLAGMPV